MKKSKNGEEVKEVKVVDTGRSVPSELIALAVEKGSDLEKLEKVLALHERWEERQAKKAFISEMVGVQKEISPVVKRLKNEQTHSVYAALDDIIKQTKETYTAHGFSISFYEGETSKAEHIRICADVSHSLGHRETYHYDIPLDGKGIKGNVNMTAIHGKGSSTSYARRYLMCMIWNIPTGDDNDGQTSETYITDQQVHVIADMVIATKANMGKFLQYVGAESLEKIPASQYKKAITALEAKAKKGGEKCLL